MGHKKEVRKANIDAFYAICECIANCNTVKSCCSVHGLERVKFYRIANSSEELREHFDEARRKAKEQQVQDLEIKARNKIAALLGKEYVESTTLKGRHKDGQFVPEYVIKKKSEYIPPPHLLLRVAGYNEFEVSRNDGTMTIYDKRKLQGKLSASILKFMQYFWDVVEPGRELVIEPHIEYLCSIIDDHVGRLVRGGTRRFSWIVVNVPPSSSKSSIFSLMLPVWLWVRDPSLRVLTASHSGALSNRFSKRSRELIRSEKFQELFGEYFQIIRSGDSVKELINAQSGMRATGSVGSSITGGHYDVIILDDLLDAQSENSKADLQAAEAYIKAAASRETDPNSTLKFLIGQRIAKKDPTDVVLEMSERNIDVKVLHICLPASNEYPILPENAKRLYDEETGLLAPIRIGESVLREKKVELGTRAFVGQYMQQPAELGGNVIKEDWFNIVDETLVPDALRRLPMNFVVDTAYEEKESSDPTAIMAYKKHKGRLYVYRCISKRIESAYLPDFIEQFVKDNGGGPRSMVRIENKASGKTIVQLLKRYTDLNVKELKVSRSKMSRLNAVAPPIEAGKCILVKGGWIEDFISEVCTFPNAPHDDMVDCLSMAGMLTWLKGTKGGYSAASA